VWPSSIEELVALQERLGGEAPELWRPRTLPPVVAGCFVCFPADDPGRGCSGTKDVFARQDTLTARETAWAGAALLEPGQQVETVTIAGETGGAYRPGLLALRAGPALEQAVAALPSRPEVLIVDATGRDHPRRAGLAFHLGQVLDLPTIGVTHRTLLADGEWPEAVRGAHAPLRLGADTVGAWLRIQPRARPIAVHAAWRTDAETAVQVVMAVARKVRTPEPLRQARRAARMARAEALATTS
jgi:deoxyribonuclease V